MPLSKVRYILLVALLACADGQSSPAPDSPDDPDKPPAQLDGGLDGQTLLDSSRPPLDAFVPPRDASRDAGAEAVATVSGGQLEGAVEGHSKVFLGIPYARANRFVPPEPAQPWSGVRAARAFGPICPQATPERRFPDVQSLPQSEDCLLLNVYAPVDADRAPVMVYIHGGSGISGAGSDYDGRYLSEAGGVVVVTLNYRLGALSWLAHPVLDRGLSVPSGNLGLRDQQLALRWVRDNIAAFGGDPARVTLFGQSAGALHTCLHMFATGSEQLVQRFVMQSGGCVNSAVGPVRRAGIELVTSDLINALCNGAADAAACLRERGADELVNYKNTRGSLQEQLTPHVDGQLLVDHPNVLARAGKFVHAPVITGSNALETNFLSDPLWGQKWPLVNNAIELLVGVTAMYPDSVLDILAHYGAPASDAAANVTMARIMDDSWFRCPARALAREASTHGGAAFWYSFDVKPGVHLQELDYVFGWPGAPVSQRYADAVKPPTPSVLRAMQRYWTTFARSGDPNDGELAWPKYEPAQPALLRLAEPLNKADDPSRADCDFWDGIYEASASQP
jgi:para-nitrobenzyl esterase